MKNLFTKVGSLAAVSLTLLLAACGPTQPAGKVVANYEPEVSRSTIYVYQYFDPITVDGDQFSFRAYGSAPSGYSLSAIGVIAVWLDASDSAIAYCKAIGGSRSSIDLYGTSGDKTAGQYFNC